MVKTYYRLTKPGIIYGNVMTAAAGFLLASQGHIDFGLMLATVLSVALVIASGCVFNNYLDRGLDAKMARTKQRALVSGEISGKNALIFASVLAIVGLTVLALFVSWLTALLGIFALVMYVVVYGWAKRRSVYGTIVGSIPGAMSLVAGYVAVSRGIDSAALILFLILALWQMPHFYAIGIFRRSDYAAAKLPILPVTSSIKTTKVHIVGYIVAFIIATTLLTIFDYTGYTYLIVLLTAGILWLRLAIKGFKAKDDVRWARKVFGFSLLVLLTFSLMISLDAWLP